MNQSCITCGTTEGMAERKARLSGSSAARCRPCYNAYVRARLSAGRDPNRTRKQHEYQQEFTCADCGAVAQRKPGKQTRCPDCQAIADATRRGMSYSARRHQVRAGDRTINHLALGERDGWLCHLCGDEVEHHTDCVDPLSATIDHVVPLARGGEHSWENVRLAHRQCNSARGAKALASHG